MHDNLHSLYMSSAPLCAVCQRCGRRSLIKASTFGLSEGRGNMTPIYEVARRLKCTSCNLKNSYAFVPPSREFAEHWQAGEIVETPGLE